MPLAVRYLQWYAALAQSAQLIIRAAHVHNITTTTFYNKQSLVSYWDCHASVCHNKLSEFSIYILNNSEHLGDTRMSLLEFI